ncbi:MAG: DUF1036 domain-containing protein [Alphaproteobacteria bacterium]|nr:DUF1036 domain-containing protein [Alphaproteobacteria bacterium]
MKHRGARRLLLGLIVGVAALCGGAQRAQAGLHFCNKSAAPWLEIAITHPDGAGGWTAEGWWRVERGQCKTVISSPLNSRYYYFLANGPGGTWFSGEMPYCIQQKKFAIRQAKFDLRSEALCAQSGLYLAKFRELNTNDLKDVTNTLQGDPPAGQSAAPVQQPRPPGQVAAPQPMQPQPVPPPARFGPPGKYPGLGEMPQRASQAPAPAPQPPQQSGAPAPQPAPVAPGGGGEACKRYPNLC